MEPFEEFWSLHKPVENRKRLFQALPDNLDYSPFYSFEPDLKDPLVNREVLAILRSDLVIVSSDFEQKFLEDRFKLTNVVNIPFLYFSQDNQKRQEMLAHQMTQKKFFEHRKNLFWIGNFLNYPNHVLSIWLLYIVIIL